MKIRISHLRSVIRAVLAEGASSEAEALAGVLFFHGERCNALRRIERAAPAAVGSRAAALAWIEENIETLRDVTHGGAVEHLGSGDVGDAYRYTDGTEMVLKIEFPSSRGSGMFHGTIADRLHGKDPIGRIYPMVYDSGDLSGGAKYGVMEKLKVPPRAVAEKLEMFVAAAMVSIRNGGSAADAVVYMLYSSDLSREWIEGRYHEIESAMLLDDSRDSVPRKIYNDPLAFNWPSKGWPEAEDVPSWYVSLFDTIKKWKGSGLRQDLHIGNLGIRTNGDWVFFD